MIWTLTCSLTPSCPKPMSLKAFWYSVSNRTSSSVFLCTYFFNSSLAIFSICNWQKISHWFFSLPILNELLTIIPDGFALALLFVERLLQLLLISIELVVNELAFGVLFLSEQDNLRLAKAYFDHSWLAAVLYLGSSFYFLNQLWPPFFHMPVAKKSIN